MSDELIKLLIEKTKAGKLEWTSSQDSYWPVVAELASARIEIGEPPAYAVSVYARGRWRTLPPNDELIKAAVKSRDAWAEEAVEHALACLERL